MNSVILYQYPWTLLCFLTLTMSIASLWIKKTVWIWGVFFAASMVFAAMSGVVRAEGFGFIGIAAIAVWALSVAKGGLRTFVCLVVCILSMLFWIHKVPWIANWKVAAGVIGHGSISYTLWFNYDKTLIGLFLLGWVIPTLHSLAQWKKMLHKAFPWIAGGMAIMIVVSHLIGLVRWDPKFPKVGFIFLWINLFFVSVVEEAVMRGFLQRELCRVWKKCRFGEAISVGIVAALFSLLHIFWIKDPIFLMMVFAAGIIFGALYQYTKAIEASILCHYLFNVTHFFFFSYPMLG